MWRGLCYPRVGLELHQRWLQVRWQGHHHAKSQWLWVPTRLSAWAYLVGPFPQYFWGSLGEHFCALDSSLPCWLIVAKCWGTKPLLSAVTPSPQSLTYLFAFQQSCHATDDGVEGDLKGQKVPIYLHLSESLIQVIPATSLMLLSFTLINSRLVFTRSCPCYNLADAFHRKFKSVHVYTHTHTHTHTHTRRMFACLLQEGFQYQLDPVFL